jgi:iron(III) transport system permease protein
VRLSQAREPRARGVASPRALLLVCAAVAIIVAAPVLISVLQAAQGGVGAARIALRATSVSLLLHSVLVALVAAPTCAVVGVGTAWFVERTRVPGRRVWALLLVAPLVVPLFVTSYAWVTLSGALQGFLGAAGIVSFAYYPIVFLLVCASLRVMDPALEETARALGVGPWRTFRRVVLPQLRPAILGGVLLVVLDTLVEFDAFVALRYQTFTTNVYSQYQLSFSPSGAAVLSVFSIVLCLALLLGESRLRGAANYTRISHGAPRRAARYELGRTTPLVLAGLALVVAVSLGIPLGLLVHWFATGTSAARAGARASVAGLWPVTRKPATRTSVLLGLAGALLAVILALPVAILAVRHRSRLGMLLERSVYLSFALPDLVAAIALAYGASHVTPFVYGTVPLIVLAEAMLFVPFAVVALRSTLGLIEPALEESARSLGLGPLRTLWRVTLPLARPGLGAAGVLVFAFVLGDLGTAQVLLPPGLTTLGTQFWADSQTVAFAAAAPYAAVLVGLALLSAWVLMSRFGRVRGGD